jgi:predicted glycosyl hydrolase (DUF1957 family)
VCAAIRHILQAQASDWAFMIHHRTSHPYAQRRLHEHLATAERLAAALAAGTAGRPPDLASYANAPGPETAADLQSILFQPLPIS